ncbi:MAG: DegT/DnrJ/EryC1/StrS family aminotransferase [Acidimicrobiales bacterium]
MLSTLGDSTRPGTRQRQVEKLERRWREATGQNHVVVCRSATAAARLAIHSLGIGPGDEIICPADASPPSLVFTAANGAVPVPVDIDPVTLQIDPAAVAAAVTPRTRAVLVADRYGTTPDYSALEAIGWRHGLVLLEDASQARGATFRGRPAGSMGTVNYCALPSLGSSATLGRGGIVATSDVRATSVVRRALLVDRIPIADDNLMDLVEAGDWTVPMSELDAAAAELALVRLEEAVAIRAANGSRLAGRLADVPGLALPAPIEGATNVYSSFPIVVLPDELGLTERSAPVLRDAIIDSLFAEGLRLDRWSPQPLGVDPVEHRLLPPGSSSEHRGPDYPAAAALVEGALVLGTAPCPLDAVDPTVVDDVADAFLKVVVEHADRLRHLVNERCRPVIG